MDKHLLNILESSNFSQKEALVYLSLLEHGSSVVSDISAKTNLKRTIIYVVLEDLEKRGYVAQVPGKKVKTYQASDPSIILNKINTAAKNFQEMLPIFRSLKNVGKSFPKIKYYETKEGILNVHREMTRAKNAFFISSYTCVDKVFPNVFDDWYEECVYFNKRQKARIMIPDTPEEIKEARRGIKAGCEVKAAKELIGIKMNFTQFDNKFAITSLEDDIFIVVFESENIINSIKYIFEMLWRYGRKIN